MESDFGLCGACWRDTPFIAGLTCDACGAPLPGSSDQAEHCDECLRTPRPWAHGRAALIYRERGRRLVLGLKHGDRHDIAGPAAKWMARLTRSLVTSDTLIVPVPLHLHRLLSRRYNQSALLAQALAQELGCEAAHDILTRPKSTASLEGKTRDARFETLSGSIALDPRRAAQIRDRPVLIVDDVMTSGATLTASTDACLAGGATQVCVSVLARAVKEP